jgi:hypothetical protein
VTGDHFRHLRQRRVHEWLVLPERSGAVDDCERLIRVSGDDERQLTEVRLACQVKSCKAHVTRDLHMVLAAGY